MTGPAVGEVIAHRVIVFVRTRWNDSRDSDREPGERDPGGYSEAGQLGQLDVALHERIVRIPEPFPSALHFVDQSVAQNLRHDAKRRVTVPALGRALRQVRALPQKQILIVLEGAGRKMRSRRELDVEPHALLVLSVRLIPRGVQIRERRGVGERLRLALVLVVDEKVNLVLPDRAAERGRDLLIRVRQDALLDEVSAVEP
jgi:hypothetical protein